MTTLFNAGDLQRLDVERRLTEQAPTVPPEQPATVPPEQPGEPLDRIRDVMFAQMLELLKEKYS
jgi:hypothetical protein